MIAASEPQLACELQREGQRPPGLPQALRLTPEWEQLRRAIHGRAMRFGDQLSFDFRELLTDAAHARVAGVLMWRLVRDLQPQVLVGPGLGATPLLYAMAMAALDDGVSLQVLMVRDKRKEHNQKRWVEGHRAAAQGKRAIFVDDFIKTGTALPLVRQALAADGVDVDLVAAAVFFDMWEPLGTRQISVSQLSMRALFTRHDVGLSRDSFDAVPPLMKGRFPDFVGATPRWWRFELNRHMGYPTKCVPAISHGAVYVVDERCTLWKHDLATGDIQWSVPSVGRHEKGSVQHLQCVQGSLVYGTYDGTLTRVHAATGAIVWRWKLDSWIHATPSIDEASGRIYVNTEQKLDGIPAGHVQCVELATGRLIWKHRHAWWPPGSAVCCARSGTVVAPCNDETLTALDAADGRLRWQAKTHGLVRGRPWIQGGWVYVATERGRLQRFDVQTGEPGWTVRYGRGLWHQFLDGNADEIYVMDNEWHFTAFALETGAMRWIARLRSPGVWGPVRCGGYLVVLSRGGHLAVFCPRRQVKVWEGSIPGAFHQPPAVGDGVLVANSSNNGLMAFNVDPFYEQQ